MSDSDWAWDNLSRELRCWFFVVQAWARENASLFVKGAAAWVVVVSSALMLNVMLGILLA